MTQVRIATHLDIPAIAALWNPIIRDTDITFTSEEKSDHDLMTYLREHSLAGDPVLVTEEAGQVVGFASYHPWRNGPGYAKTREVTVAIGQDFWGKGHGRELLQELETKAKSQGIHVLVAGITDTNTDSQRFFSRMGFAMVGRILQVGWKFDRWHNLIFMQKIL